MASTISHRAHAHYRWADRYKRRQNDEKRLAHLRRGDHYARLSAFGVDRAQIPVTTLMVGSDLNPIDEDGPICPWRGKKPR